MNAPHDSLREDRYMEPLVEEHGELSLAPAEDFFERFVVSILRQQVSMESAAATRERLFEAVDVTPEGILAADESTLKDAGLSRQKIRYVQNIAEAFRDRRYSQSFFEDMSDDEVRAELTAIAGVGEWTANMQLMFALGREDVFPVGDLGIRKGMWELYHGNMDREEMREAAEQWRPYRSYASLYLWRVSEA